MKDRIDWVGLYLRSGQSNKTAGVAVDPALTGDMNRAELTSLSAAEQLLDRLEADGTRDRSLEIVGESEFVVRWHDLGGESGEEG